MANKQTIKSVKGTRDFYPKEMSIRTWLYDNMRKVSESFGYQEYEAPILETLELYAAKSGEEIVNKQSYVFEDRSGDKITLRPELTPSLARMVAKKQGQLTFPLRWWSFGPFWRYERPQKGRSREFFQWNIDMIGDGSAGADAELVIIAATFLKNLGLKSDEVQIKVNDRELIETETSNLGLDEDQRAKSLLWIDKKDKLNKEAWTNYGKELGFDEDQIIGIEGMINDKDLWKKSERLSKVFEIVEAYGMSDYISYDPGIIRGLLYYTGTVFEAWDTAGDFRALFGGGRYDNLVGDVGGQDVGGVGFACGDVVIKLLLDKLGRLPEVGDTPADFYVTVFDEDTLIPSLTLAKEIRQAGIKVTSHLKIEKLGKQFKYADRIGSRFALVLGPDEIANNQVNLKNLGNGEQKQILRSELINELKNILEG